ncbi:hypothetical protein D3C87_1928750 [compost metagenome]
MESWCFLFASAAAVVLETDKLPVALKMAGFHQRDMWWFLRENRHPALPPE